MSYSAVRPDGVAVYPAAQATPSDRVAFIQKVYGLLFLGILFFAASMSLPVAGIVYEIPVLREIGMLAIACPWWLALIVLIGSSFLIHSVSMIRGINIVAFFAMAGMWGFFTVGLIYYALATSGFGVIFQAAGLTTLVFGGLSAFALISRKDFSFLGGFLMISTLLLLGTIVGFAIFGAGEILQIGLSLAIVAIFSLYVLYDTSRMLHHYAVDMVVPAALALLVDFIILFRQILFLLISSRD